MLIILGIYSLMVTVIAIALKQISSKSLSKYLEEIDYLKEKNCILSRRIQDCSHQLCDKTKEIIELRDVRDLLEKKIKDQEIGLIECKDKISNLLKLQKKNKKSKVRKIK